MIKPYGTAELIVSGYADVAPNATKPLFDLVMTHCGHIWGH